MKAHVETVEFIRECHIRISTIFLECFAVDKAYAYVNLFDSHKNPIKSVLSFSRLYNYRKLLSVNSG